MLLTPGPVALPESVKQALSAPILHHRSDAFEAALAETQVLLQRAFGLPRDVLIMTSSGSGALDAAVCNLIADNDQVVALRGGKFGQRFGDYARAQGGEVEVVEHDPRAGFDLDALFAKVNKETRALLLTATETASGAKIDLEAICQRAQAFPDLLLLVDGIAWLGTEELGPWIERVDVMLGASQKAFASTAGLAFAQLSPRAEARLIGHRGYFDFELLVKAARSGSVAYSMPSSLLLALRAGLEWLYSHDCTPAALHLARAQGFRSHAQEAGLELLPLEAANSLSTLLLPVGADADQIREQLQHRDDFHLAAGQDEWAGKILRVGHMGEIDESRWPALASTIANYL